MGRQPKPRPALKILQRRLAERNTGLVWHFARMYVDRAGCGMDIEELVSVGYLGLCIAASKFDESRGFQFSTYAAVWIKAEIRRAILLDRVVHIPANPSGRFEGRRREAMGHHAISLHSMDTSYDPPAPEPVGYDEDTFKAVMAIVDRLPSLWRATIRARLAGKTLEEIAQSRGVTRSTVHKLENNAIREIRRRLGVDDPAPGWANSLSRSATC